mmetsp:Transcript_20736/g.41057  ORF Transcript_20736/g.41057 Transcript_20736/m.41057 type:complete len:232 (+) Transcript_20736:414-1109(+)
MSLGDFFHLFFALGSTVSPVTSGEPCCHQVVQIHTIKGQRVDQRDRVVDQSGFRRPVEVGVGGHGRAGVDLQQPRPELGVDQHVEAVDLKAVHLPPHRVLHGDECFEHHSNDLLPKLCPVYTQVCHQQLGQACQGQLGAVAGVAHGRAGSAVLLYSEVGEVHEKVVCVRQREGDRTEPREPLVVDEGFQRQERSDQHIQTEIELVAPQQKRVAHILLNDEVLAVIDIVHLL